MATKIKGKDSPATTSDEALDETLDESFPASDPPSWTLGNGTVSTRDRNENEARDRDAQTRDAAAREAAGLEEDAPGGDDPALDVDQDKRDESLSRDEPRHPLRARGTAPPPSRP
jgi:hypothetical protein